MTVFALFLCAFLLLSCSEEQHFGVDLQSQYYEFEGGSLQTEPALPSDMDNGFTLVLSADLSAPDGLLLEAPGTLQVEKTADALEVRLTLQQYYDPTEFRTQSVSIPLRFYPFGDGVHNLTVQFTGALLEVYLDGRLVDNDASLGYPAGERELILSDDVKSVAVYAPAMKAVRAANREDNTSKYSARNIQYWTPDFHNGWVGDVVSCWHKGRYHLFYLFDRRHHGGKFGHGGHWFEHLSTADFKTWTEHETALPLSDQWMTYGTGTAFTWKDSLLITYGFHTSRFRNFEQTTFPLIRDNADAKGYCEPLVAADYPDLYPEGGTYAVSPDGISPFEPSGIFFHYSENPSVFPDPEGEGLRMYANYLAHGTWVADDIDGPWTCTDPYFPPGGDCTFPFAIGDWEYIVGGFHNMWYRSRSQGGPFRDMIPDATDIYNGISVPTFTVLPDGRCIMAGWTNNEGWGGNLVLYEVVQRPDGTLGTRWMDEILTRDTNLQVLEPSGDGSFSASLDRGEDCMISFRANVSDSIRVRFGCSDFPGEVLQWSLNPDGRASYVRLDSASANSTSTVGEKALLISEGGRPEWMNDYAVMVKQDGKELSVRMYLHNEAKMSGTLIDTEINRDRTMLDHQKGFKFDSVSFSDNLTDLRISPSARKSLDSVDRESFGAGPSPLEAHSRPMKRKGRARMPEESSSGRLCLDGTWILEGAEPANADIKVEADVPCSIHKALFDAGVIPDPLVGLNDTLAERCSYQKWTLSRSFEYDGSMYRPVLYFEGVANKCRVYLNGECLGSHEGMFGGPEYDLSGKLVTGTNTLRVELDNINEYCDWNSTPSENGNWKYTVVINCVYGWHYSKIPSLGIWNSVSVRDNRCEIGNPFIATRSLDGKMNLSFNLPDTVTAAVELAVREKYSRKRALIYTACADRCSGEVSFDFDIPHPKLWWPEGTGRQNVYEALIRLKQGNNVISEKRTDFGVRTIEMAPFPEGPREDLYNWTFVVNGRPMFVKGTGWCTDDVLLDFSTRRYRTFLSAAKEQHVQILRAWGCGMPEKDEFYRLCDSLGIMVIQEWPTAWGTHDVQPFDVLEETVERNTLRLRNHPSLVMWGAGNETAWPFGKSIDMMGRLSIELDGTRPFHRGEPWGGSAHDYTCWWGDAPLDYNLNLTSRFLGEFGIPSFPARETMEHYLQEEPFCWPPKKGSSLEHHMPTFNTQGDVYKSDLYSGTFMKTDSMDKLILASQISQAEGVRHTLERARTMWPETTGIMSYKLNDNYPAMSWSTVDYYGRKKLGHYTTKMAFEPLTTVLLFDRLNLAGGDADLPYWFLDDMETMDGRKLRARLRIIDNDMNELADTVFRFRAEGRVMKIADVHLNERQTSPDNLVFVTDLYCGLRRLNRNRYVMNCSPREWDSPSDHDILNN